MKTAGNYCKLQNLITHEFNMEITLLMSLLRALWHWLNPNWSELYMNWTFGQRTLMIHDNLEDHMNIKEMFPMTWNQGYNQLILTKWTTDTNKRLQFFFILCLLNSFSYAHIFLIYAITCLLIMWWYTCWYVLIFPWYTYSLWAFLIYIHMDICCKLYVCN